MMAAEAFSEKPVDVSVTDASLSTAPNDPSAQNGEAISAATLNGTVSQDEPEKVKAVNDIVDDLANSAEVSVSGGSDTEASTRAKDPNHVRTSSTVKKPQSFKSVSVNKTFLGAKNAASAVSRSETSSPSLAPATPVSAVGSSASKLKLVAKSGSSLGGASKTLTTNGKAPSAPDGSTVWNRNKAPVPEEPKKYSDEELKKYGIHMADRLRPEDDRGQSNWADEDEDEEWAPEAITWTDGTRITLENQPTPSIAPAVPTPAAPVANVPVPPSTMPAAPLKEQPKSPVPGVATESARASPSVKPSLIASGKSLVLKGAPEKPTLVAKAPAMSTPAKSPWAPLPPVDRASPVLMELPNHQQQMPPPMRGYPPRDSPFAQNPNLPAKEIAADDFSRGPWRDGQPAGNRELFNSQSGRYEPVQDRRGSRHDPNYRQHPALLQRPSQQQDFQGPAEPSAAFQTSRSSGHDATPYGRRRTSSNVSGGSGSLMHRLGRPHDMAPLEQVAPAPGQPSPARSQHAQPWQPRPSPGQINATLQPAQLPPVDVPADVPAAAAPSDNDIELQKRLMRERREMAIKRRLEGEANEEAARKERIALKLAAMGPAPERKSAKKEETKEVAFKRDGPPVGIFSKEELATAAAERGATQTALSSPDKQEAATVGSVSKSGNSAETASPENQHTEPARSGPSSGPQPKAPWPEPTQKPTDRVASWSGGSQSGPRNLWAAPAGNDRFLGNGTFDADLGQLADSEPAQPASMTSRPTPIGPPRSAHQAPQRLAPIGPPSGNRPGAQPPHTGVAPRRNPWATADIAADDRAIRAERQARLEEQRKTLETQGVSANESQHTVRDTWRGVDIDQDGRRMTGHGVTTQHNERMDRHPGPSWNAPMPPHLGPDHGGHDQLSQPPYQQAGLPDGPYTRAAPLGPAGHGPAGHGPAAHPRAGSRFFPHGGSRDIRQEDATVPPRSKSPTPPPPTMDGHPAYDGDAGRPHVTLPPTRPVVKLPPAAQRPQQVKQAPVPIAPPKPATFAAAAAAAATPAPRPTGTTLSGRGANYANSAQSAGEIKTQENWQQRINSLMRAPHAKPISIDSSSKYAFDAHANTSTTVSLPALSPGGSSSFSETSDVTSKEMAEECFDEQEMGSLPLVNLPNEAPSALWSNKAVEPNWLPLNTKYRVDANASESLRFPYEVVNHKSVYRILMNGMEEAKTVPAPYTPRNRSDSRRQGRGGRGTRGGLRGRDSSGDHQSSSSVAERPDRPDRPERPERSERTSSRGGRGSFRSRSEHWSKSSSALSQPTQS
ncbi:hypothetical protein BJ166DRAFT_58693 [Pestalotiopsis sp. NC0098]|nr:hypothetical protein BJ166DRAFT_58693 [Pestalotiopsis sp. NC0098]